MSYWCPKPEGTTSDIHSKKSILKQIISVKTNINWETILTRLQNYPNEACEKDKFGVTALHHVIRKERQQHLSNRTNKIPMEIFELLIKECPQSVEYSDSMTGRNALHIACSGQCSDEMKDVVGMILDLNRETAMHLCQDGRLALHKCNELDIAKRLIEIYPDGLGVVTKTHGYLPIHGACSDSNAVPSVVKLIIENGIKHQIGTKIRIKNSNSTSTTTTSTIFTNNHYCGGLLVKDTHGDNPVKIIFRRLMFLKHDIDPTSDLWKKLCIVVKATYLALHGLPYDTEKERNIPLVHAIIECGGHTSLVKFALGLYPEQALLRDIDGRVPLSIASSKVDANPEIITLLLEQEEKNLAITRTSTSTSSIPVSSSISVQKKVAASMADKNGRLSLHKALESGRTLKNGVELIANAAPQAMETRDIQTGMYPFMLASIPNYKWDNTCVDTIYSMIRSVPHVMQKYCPKDDD